MGTVISGWSENASWPASGSSPGGARAVANDRAERYSGRGVRDLGVGDAEKHRPGGARRGAAPERTLDGVAAIAQGGGDRRAQPARADDGQAVARVRRGGAGAQTALAVGGRGQR